MGALVLIGFVSLLGFPQPIALANGVVGPQIPGGIPLLGPAPAACVGLIDPPRLLGFQQGMGISIPLLTELASN